MWSFLKGIAREAAVYVGTRVLVEGLMTIFTNNADMTPGQREHLRNLLTKLIDNHRQGRPTRHVIQGICLVVAPDAHRELSDLISSFMESNGSSLDEVKSNPGRYDADYWDSVTTAPPLDLSTPSRSSRGAPTLERQHSWRTGPLPSSRSTPSSSSSSSSSRQRDRSPSSRSRQTAPSASTPSAEAKREEAMNNLILANEFGLSDAVIARIPAPLKSSLITTLKTNSTCCISMEELVEDTKEPLPRASLGSQESADEVKTRPTRKKLIDGVVVLFQRADQPGSGGGRSSGRSGSSSSGRRGESAPLFHAYLFSKEALDAWFVSSGRPTNPLTRSDIDMRTQYFQLT